MIRSRIALTALFILLGGLFATLSPAAPVYQKDNPTEPSIREYALTMVKSHETPSKKTIEEIINERAGQTIDGISYGEAQWIARRISTGQFVEVICIQKSHSAEDGDKDLRLEWFFDGHSVVAVYGNRIDDGLVAIPRAKLLQTKKNAPPVLSQ